MIPSSKCRSCDAPIRWCRTEATGKLMPLDPDPVDDGNVWVLRIESGTPVVAVALLADAVPTTVPLRYVSHFVTCKDAATWRKTRMTDDNTLLGVVTPFRDDEEALEAQALARDGWRDRISRGPEDVVPPRSATEFEVASALVDQQLSSVRTRLQLLRSERTHINEQIRQLVDDEELLQRMARVRPGRRGPQRESSDEA